MLQLQCAASFSSSLLSCSHSHDLPLEVIEVGWRFSLIFVTLVDSNTGGTKKHLSVTKSCGTNSQAEFTLTNRRKNFSGVRIYNGLTETNGIAERAVRQFLNGGTVQESIREHIS